jgi:signal transduction histidine kinase
MKISDNGKGFSKTETPGNEGGGNGLHNMRQRANEIKGHLEILTGKNSGTSVEIKVRV